MGGFSRSRLTVGIRGSTYHVTHRLISASSGHLLEARRQLMAAEDSSTTMSSTHPCPSSGNTDLYGCDVPD